MTEENKGEAASPPSPVPPPQQSHTSMREAGTARAADNSFANFAVKATRWEVLLRLATSAVISS